MSGEKVSDTVRLPDWREAAYAAICFAACVLAKLTVSASSVQYIMVFIELPIFIRCAASLFTDEDLVGLQVTLLENPAAGDLIKEGRGLRKLRVPLPGRGKSGGARVIYYHWVSEQHATLSMPTPRMWPTI